MLLMYFIWLSYEHANKSRRTGRYDDFVSIIFSFCGVASSVMTVDVRALRQLIFFSVSMIFFAQDLRFNPFQGSVAFFFL